MQPNTTSGQTIILKPAEELVPYEPWLAWLKKFAIYCVKQAHITLKSGTIYQALDFWMVLILHALMNLSLDEASDRLNQIRWDTYNTHQRKKQSPPTFKGKGNRRRRKCPNGDQVRKYRNKLPKWLVDKLNRFIFQMQLDYALQEGLIKKKIDLLVDNTSQWYYGNERYPRNPFITKGYNGPGTSRKRNYLGIMLKCGTTYLYCGVEIIKKKHSNVPFILEVADFLLKKGFAIRYLIGDRWFPTVELLRQLPSRKIHFIGPYKKYTPIKRLIETYLKHGGKYILPYRIQGIQVWLILTNGQGRRLREIRRDYLKKTKSLEDCMKDFMVMLTTVKPPAGKKKRQGWAVQICRVYDHRWQIETGFRDLNRITPPSNARTNARKFFMTSVRYWVFNCWQLERARRRKLRKVPSSWRKGPTLRRFSYCVMRAEVLV